MSQRYVAESARASVPLLGLLLPVFCLPLTSGASSCTNPYGDCFNSTCCSHGFDCKKKQHRLYAQCRPRPSQGCVDEPGWDCPDRWVGCSEKHSECTDSKCCKDPTFGCFRRGDRQYAQCRELPTQGTCTDAPGAEWRCPGWELCSGNHESCTQTLCCADERFACYEKRPHYSQCMRRGECVPGRDGTCVEQRKLLGQCSAAYRDCHQTACCQRGEDHCFLKNEGYGMCMPTCDAISRPDWQCRKHELPSERMKLTCEDLRGKANLYHQTCATRYTSRSNCESAYASSKNVYRPCQWEPVSQICEESPQRLACDCALLHKDCPKSKNRASTTAQVADDELSAGEGVTIFFSVVIILGGIAGLAW